MYRQIGLYERTFPVVPLTPAVVLEAVRGVRDHQFPYYDAQIWAAAKLNQVPVVLSEDFASGSTVEGVTFVNPFDRVRHSRAVAHGVCNETTIDLLSIEHLPAAVESVVLNPRLLSRNGRGRKAGAPANRASSG